MEPQPLEAMTEEQLLGRADDCAVTIRQADVELLRVAYQWALIHGPGRLDARRAAFPGREGTRRLGGEGTDDVCEFAAAELGARIGRSPAAAASLMADALDLRHRLPALWRRVEGGEVLASYARHVARATRGLTADEALLVDGGVVESADGRISWTRFEQLVEGQVAAAAPAATKAREEQAARARFVKLLRQTDPDLRHGMASFLIRADLATITQIDAVITAVATTLKTALSDLTTDELRVRALMLLLHLEADPDVCDPAEPDPGVGADLADIDLKALLPTVQLFVHMYADEVGIPSATARVEGHGPVTRGWLRDVLGPNCRFTITPVLDIAGQAPVDAYEIPARHRTAVRMLTPADTFPYASSLSPTMQLDHTIPWTPPDEHGPPGQAGQSRIGNYGPMTTFHHRIKTHGGWAVTQPFPGIYLWRDPHGHTYLVDHTGTRVLRTAANIDLVFSSDAA